MAWRRTKLFPWHSQRGHGDADAPPQTGVSAKVPPEGPGFHPLWAPVTLGLSTSKVLRTDSFRRDPAHRDTELRRRQGFAGFAGPASDSGRL